MVGSVGVVRGNSGWGWVVGGADNRGEVAGCCLHALHLKCNNAHNAHFCY